MPLWTGKFPILEVGGGLEKNAGPTSLGSAVDQNITHINSKLLGSPCETSSEKTCP